MELYFFWCLIVRLKKQDFFTEQNDVGDEWMNETHDKNNKQHMANKVELFFLCVGCCCCCYLNEMFEMLFSVIVIVVVVVIEFVKFKEFEKESTRKKEF